MQTSIAENKEISKDSENLQDFQKHKELAIKTDLQERFKEKPKKAKRCAECGETLVFDTYQNTETGETAKKLVFASFCKNKWCPMCAWRKSRKLITELKSVIDQIEAKQQVKFLFLTLTIKNPQLTELRETIKHMSKAFNKLTKEPEFKKSILGYIRAIEYLGDNTKQGEAHPHFHTILVVSKTAYYGGNYIKQSKWAEMWQKSLKADYTPIVDIRKIRAKGKKWREADSALFETIKYSVAPLELINLTKENFTELDKQTAYIRQYNKGGLFKTIKPIPEAKLDEDLWELLQTEYYQWLKKEYNLARTQKNKKDKIA